ncbi:OsmC family protein [Parapedobacter pyrenivorans]|uniref:OsmC family protein n=1 Tax=Parapedobacter pyrenivorans TaxID=1305674 RepID=UPI003340A503
MKITLNRVNDAVHFEGSSNTTDVKVHIDGSPNIGGEGLGTRPMELVLMALGSCSALDLVSILKKQRQQIDDIKIDVEGQRREDIPQVFTAIHILFSLSGAIDQAKAEKAAELAVKKYCSVHDMLAAGGIDITYDIQIH